MIVVIQLSKISGSLFGVALGDALGRDPEFMPLKQIHARYGRTGRMRLPHSALFTDDTQMTLAVGHALLSARTLTRRELVRTLTNAYVHWAANDPRRAPGVTCITAISRLRQTRANHRGWWFASQANSKGCGANMRVAPVAFLPSDYLVTGVSQLQAALTHGHPTALAATELSAYAIRWAARDVPLRELPIRLRNHAQEQRGVYHGIWLDRLSTRWGPYNHNMVRGWDECLVTLDRVIELLNQRSTPSDMCKYLGEGWVAEEALAVALYCAVKFAHDPVLAISMAARTSGDSDSIASIAGGIIGAQVGEEAWPVDWRDRIERSFELQYVARQIHKQFGSLSQ